MGLSFDVDEIRLIPVWGLFGILGQKSSKLGQFSFGATGLWFDVDEIRLLPVWGNIPDFSAKNHQTQVCLVSVRRVYRLTLTR